MAFVAFASFGIIHAQDTTTKAKKMKVVSKKLNPSNPTDSTEIEKKKIKTPGRKVKDVTVKTDSAGIPEKKVKRKEVRKADATDSVKVKVKEKHKVPTTN